MIGLFKQEFKSLFKSPASISILIIPIVMMIGLGFLLPSAWIVPSAITIGIVASVLLYFGGSIEEVKRTSFMKSISLTRLNKFSYLSTKILFSVLISFFSVLWVLFFAWFFTDIVDFLAKNFGNLIPEGTSGVMNIVRTIPFEVNWSSIHWLTLFYAGVMTIVVSISISFIFVTFSKSSLSFYLMSFGYLLGMILFGGVVMPSFLIAEDNAWFKNLYYIIPNYFTNNMMAASFGNSIGSTIHGLTELLNSFGANTIDPETVIKINDFFDSWDGNTNSLISFMEQMGFNQNLIQDFSNTINKIMADGQITLDDIPMIENAFGIILQNGVDGIIMSILYAAHNNTDLIFNFFTNNANYLADLIGNTIDGLKINTNTILLGKLTLIYDSDSNILYIKNFAGNVANINLLDNIPSILTGLLTIDGKEEITLNIYGITKTLKLDSVLDIIGLNSTFLYIDIINLSTNGIAPVLDSLIGNGDPGSALLTIHKLTNTLDSMFKSPKLFNFSDINSTFDVIMPWIETILFVSISTTFFKWS